LLLGAAEQAGDPGQEQQGADDEDGTDDRDRREAEQVDLACRRDAPVAVQSRAILFLDPRSREFYRDWDLAAQNNVALLRAAAGRDPHDQELIKLVGQLSTQSEEFRSRLDVPADQRTRRGPAAREQLVQIGVRTPDADARQQRLIGLSNATGRLSP
jgi:hypothetical protein